MKKPTMASFRITMIELKPALSRMPRTSTQVIKATISTAGRLKMSGMPATRGARCQAWLPRATASLSVLRSIPAALASASL